MIQTREQLGLAVEALDEGGIAREVVRQNLQRDETVELRLAGFVNRSHPASPEEFDDFQVGKMGRDFRDGRRRRGFSAG